MEKVSNSLSAKTQQLHPFQSSNLPTKYYDRPGVDLSIPEEFIADEYKEDTQEESEQICSINFNEEEPISYSKNRETTEPIDTTPIQISGDKEIVFRKRKQKIQNGPVFRKQHTSMSFSKVTKGNKKDPSCPAGRSKQRRFKKNEKARASKPKEKNRIREIRKAVNSYTQGVPDNYTIDRLLTRKVNLL